jgi:hypothetical protein
VLSVLLAFYHIFNSCHFSSIVVPIGVVEFCAQDYDDPFTPAWCMSVWPVATHKGKLTARRLVITFVPKAFRVAKSTASNASGAPPIAGKAAPAPRAQGRAPLARRVVRVEPLGSDRFGLNGIVVVHAGLDAADAYAILSPDSHRRTTPPNGVASAAHPVVTSQTR